jgi:hypothetical protein
MISVPGSPEFNARSIEDPVERRKALMQEYRRKYYEKNKEKVAERARQWQAANPQYQKSYHSRPENKIRAVVRASVWAEVNPQRVYKNQREGRLWRVYKMTPSQWAAMLEAQGNACACCGSSDPGCKKGWATDHCHETGKVRGIICYKCNRNLGHLGDQLEEARRRVATYLAYLEKHA